MLVIHFLQKLDLSRRFLIEDLLQFNSRKRPPPIGNHQLVTFRVVTWGRLDHIWNVNTENLGLDCKTVGFFLKISKEFS